jgi:putative ABC transport system permease protein
MLGSKYGLTGPSTPLNRGKLRQTFRRLWKNRGFSSSVVLTLGLGIGATVSVFSIIYAVMIRPLPYADPAHLVSVFQSKVANDEADLDGFSPANFLDFRAQNHVFTDLAAYCGFHYNLTGHGEPKHLDGAAVSSGLFAILGVQPMLGRTFLPDEDSYSSPHVVLLSHSLWSGEFRGDPQIVGKSISLNGDPYYVVGVMPVSFHSPDDEGRDLWVPLQQQVRPDRMLSRDQHYLQVVGRLRPGIKLDLARTDMNRIAAQLRAQYPSSDNGSGAVVMPLQQALVGETRRSLLLALGIVVLVLLIASSNVAILMLTRVSGRTRELAVRMALGASTSEILSEVLVESLVLGLLSGLLGLFLALIGGKVLLHFAPDNDIFPLIQINPAVLAFAVGVSLIVGFGFGILPALKVLKTDIQHILRNAGNATTMDAAGRFLRHALVTGEISLSIVLLIATGLLLRSMLNLQHQPLGFRTDRVITSWIGLPRIRYQNNNDVASFFTRVDQNLRNSPGGEAVGLGYPLPLTGNHFWTSFTIVGRNTNPGEYESASLRFVDSGFLPVMNIPILNGRNFTDADDANAQPVALVSEGFAHKYWPGEDAVGKYISILRDNAPVSSSVSNGSVQDSSVPRRVVGIVRDVRSTIEDAPPPTMYVSYKQMSFPSMTIVLLSRDASGSALAKIRQGVQSVDPEQPVEYVDSMESIVSEELRPWRFALALLGGLAGLAIILTGVGLFAVVSYLVRERTKELGLRMAIGASRSSVVKLVLGQSLKLALLGTGIGLALTFTVVHLMTSMVYAIHPNDPATFVVVALLVAAISMLAAYVPARRAARIEPLAALREE